MALTPSPFSRMASVGVSGLVSTTTQSFAGDKTFTGALNVSGAAILGSLAVTGSATVGGNAVVVARKLVTPMTLYVTTTGNDTTGDGSVGTPFRQVQRALVELEKYDIRAAVTISVGAGSFDAFAIDSARIKIVTAAGPSETTGSLTISGTTQTPTLATGATSGTLTATATVVDASSVCVDTTATWTAGNLKGRYVIFGASTYLITDNTTNSFRIATNTTPASGTAYSFTEPATNIDTNTASINGTGATSRIIFTGLVFTQLSTITVQWLKLSLDGVNNGMSVRCCALVQFCQFIRTSGSAQVALVTFLSAAGTTQFQWCYSNLNGTTGSHYSKVNSPGAVTITNCYMVGATNGITGSNHSGPYIVTQTTFDTVVNGINIGPGVSSYILAANRFLTVSGSGIVTATTSTSNYIDVAFGTTASYFTGCANIATLSGLGAVYLGPISGVSNTNGLILSKGMHAQVSATGTLGTSGTEVSIDGTATTLAAMRALSPKVYPATASPYGTCIFE